MPGKRIGTEEYDVEESLREAQREFVESETISRRRVGTAVSVSLTAVVVTVCVVLGGVAFGLVQLPTDSIENLVSAIMGSLVGGLIVAVVAFARRK